MIFLILYLFSFLLMWFENKLIVLPISKRPVLFGGPFFQPLLWVVRLASQYGSIAGLWYAYNIRIAIVAFIIIYIFGKITFKIYYNREVKWTAEYLVNLIRKDTITKGETLSETDIYNKAYAEACDLVSQNMKTGGRGF